MSLYQRLVLRLLMAIFKKVRMVPGVATYDSDAVLEEDVVSFVEYNH